MTYLDILNLNIGYAIGISHLFAPTFFPRTQNFFRKSRFFFILMVAWFVFSIFAEKNAFYIIFGPSLFFVLTTFYRLNFEKNVSYAESKNTINLGTLESEIEENLKTLKVLKAKENALANQLEKITKNCMISKETLSQLKKPDFCQKTLDILVSLDGVRSAAIFDNALICARPKEKSEIFASVFDDFIREKTLQNREILPFTMHYGNSITGHIFIECETQKQESLKTTINYMKPAFSMGFRRAALFEEYELKSRHDSLTGLINRRYLESKLETEYYRAKRYGNKFAVAMLDIDYFKKVNDVYGHLAGDSVLKIVGDMLSSLEYPGAFAGRYGGEEFVVCLPFCDKENAGKAAEEIRKKIYGHDFLIDSDKMIKLKIAASIGVAGYPTDADEIKKLLSCADAALYKAKEVGRNRTVVYSR